MFVTRLYSGVFLCTESYSSEVCIRTTPQGCRCKQSWILINECSGSVGPDHNRPKMNVALNKSFRPQSLGLLFCVDICHNTGNRTPSHQIQRTRTFPKSSESLRKTRIKFRPLLHSSGPEISQRNWVSYCCFSPYVFKLSPQNAALWGPQKPFWIKEPHRTIKPHETSAVARMLQSERYPLCTKHTMRNKSALRVDQEVLKAQGEDVSEVPDREAH